MPQTYPCANLRRAAGLGSLSIGLFATIVIVMSIGCNKSQPERKNAKDLLRELTQVDSESPAHDEKTIAAQAEKLLSNQSKQSGYDSDTTSTPAVSKKDDAVLVIDSVPDKPDQALPVEDDNSTPWMFDSLKPRTTWEVLYRGNVPVGYTSKKSNPSSRGSEAAITTEFRSVLRFAKEGLEVRRELDINTVERPNGELISLTARSQTGSDSQMFVVRVDGTKADLELTINKTKQQKVIEWDGKVRGPFAIEQSMMRKPLKDNESRLVTLLDPLSGRIVESRLDAQSKYKSPVMLGKSKLLRETKVTTRDGNTLSESTIWSDEDGVILKSYVQAGDLRIFQVDEETYQEIESAFDLSFSANTSMQLTIKPGKEGGYLDAIEKEDQVTYRFQQRQSDPYKSLSSRCNQRRKSLDAFTSEVTVFRLTNREQLPGGVESPDKPTTSDSEWTSLLDSNNPLFDKIYTDLLPQDYNDNVHLKVQLVAQRLSEKYESVAFDNDIRKLTMALSTNRLNSVEQSMVLIALLRKEKIPARMALGYAYDRKAAMPTMVFQAWVEYHHAEWWWPIDPTRPSTRGLLDRIKMKEISSFSSDVRRDITKVLELGSEGTVIYQD
ncbi:MAG: transglutaminase-like domain-containing protein [Pirellula sp.]|nr:transglutaminase-like domain-containing protein [Pirellula sp.]